MKIDRTAWRERIWLVGAAGVYLTANLGYFIAGRAVDASREASLARRKSEAQERLASAREAWQSARTDSQHVAQVKEAAAQFYGKTIGTVDATMSSTVAEIHEVCRRSGVAPHSISYAIVREEGAPLSRMTIAFAVAGDYATLRRLLRGFEEDPRWLVVRSIGLSRKSETVGEGSLQLTATTYFYDPSHAIAPARLGAP